MAQQSTTSPSGPVLVGYRWLALLFAALVVVQAFLGSRGVFDADASELITGHEMLANAMFLLVVLQTVLAWMLSSRGAVGGSMVVFNAALVLLTIGQIGLGYSTRSGENFITTVSLHIPNGVLMMGVSTVIATMAWRIHSDPVPPKPLPDHDAT